MLRESCCHGWRLSERTVNRAVVVPKHVKRNGRVKVPFLLRVGIREARHAFDALSELHVLPLDVTRADILLGWMTSDRDLSDHCSRDGTSRRGRTRCQTAAGRGPGCVSCRKIILDRSPNVCMRFVRLVKL